jgi:hypothetical protein
MGEERTELHMSVPVEMKRRIKKRAEEEGYSGMSDYARSMIRAGESNVADLDPRTSSSSDGSLDIETRILDALTDEFQEVDDAIDPVVNSIATRLDRMAGDDSYPVRRHPRKGYKLIED